MMLRKRSEIGCRMQDLMFQMVQKVQICIGLHEYALDQAWM